MSNGTTIKHRFLTFYGPINLPATNSLRVGLATLINEGAQEVTLLFASDGGSISDGIALYTYLKALPIKLNMHATGVIASIAVPIFLAADRANRFASSNARFFVHEYVWAYSQGATLGRSMLDEPTLILQSADAWTRDILKASTQLTDGDFETLKLFREPRIIDPGSATNMGLIAAVAEPRIAVGSQARVALW
jgi:ATP-dependent Clp protease protease subunit